MKRQKATFALCILLYFCITSSASAQIPDVQEPSTAADTREVLTGGVPMGRWKEGLLFEGVRPMPWLKSAANWFPGTEEVQPDEMRVTFMGTAPNIRPGQMNTSIYVELGNGDNFVFDMGEGAVANYVAARVALNQLKTVFITHLHVDHFGSLPYLYMFGTWAGGWHENLTIYGPSGRTPEYGTKEMVDGMKKMLGWHRDAFSVFPVGKGWDIKVNEFDFRDNGGTIYDKNGVTVIHWQRSHAKDGASGYRLDWNGMCFV
jgi:ribonuclease Z